MQKESKEMKNRLLSLLLCLVLCVSMFPAGASAECEHSLVKVDEKSTCAEAYIINKAGSKVDDCHDG